MKYKIFVLGDSISMHYGLYLQEMLGRDYIYDRKGGIGEIESTSKETFIQNGGDSRRVLDFLLSEQGLKFLDCDVILLNCGLHDIKRNTSNGSIMVSANEYTSNLDTIISKITKQGISPVWCSSTPVEDKRHNSLNTDFLRYNRDIQEYNRIALEVMNHYSVPLIDLYGFTERITGEVYCDHIHFLDTVRKLQAAFIAGQIAMFSQSRQQAAG